MLQIRIWARPDMYDQTAYALELAAKAYEFYTNYFRIPEVVSKAGTLFLLACNATLTN
jgi:aminopeptidase N